MSEPTRLQVTDTQLDAPQALESSFHAKQIAVIPRKCSVQIRKSTLLMCGESSFNGLGAKRRLAKKLLSQRRMSSLQVAKG